MPSSAVSTEAPDQEHPVLTTSHCLAHPIPTPIPTQLELSLSRGKTGNCARYIRGTVCEDLLERQAVPLPFSKLARPPNRGPLSGFERLREA